MVNYYLLDINANRIYTTIFAANAPQNLTINTVLFPRFGKSRKTDNHNKRHGKKIQLNTPYNHNFYRKAFPAKCKLKFRCCNKLIEIK